MTEITNALNQRELACPDLVCFLSDAPELFGPSLALGPLTDLSLDPDFWENHTAGELPEGVSLTGY
ncbi:MAG: hypothetical protein WC371_05930, partial [Parachlamydiales bacterium]